MTDRKLPTYIENPIDNQILYHKAPFYKIFRKLNFTPNDITTLSLILGILSIYCFVVKKFTMSAICYFISYCFDVYDGNYARTYNMVTRFGDYYDHIKDLIVNISLLYVFIKYTTIKQHTTLIICITCILLLCTLIHLGCQENYVYINKLDSNSEYLSFLQRLCPTKV